MNYKIIDVDNWERKELFRLYTNELKIGINITVEMDVTNVVKFAKKGGYKFYPCMIWAVSKVVNAHDEYKYGKLGGKLVLWDSVSPSFTDFNSETKQFNKFTSEYSEDFKTFYETCQKDREKFKNESGFVGNPPENVFDITCIPWVNYKAFTMHIETEPRFFPVVSWGKFIEKDDRFTMPVTIDYNHAVGDGYNASMFFNYLQEFIDNFDKNVL